jgi:hypothetical protein
MGIVAVETLAGRAVRGINTRAAAKTAVGASEECGTNGGQAGTDEGGAVAAILQQQLFTIIGANGVWSQPNDPRVGIAGHGDTGGLVGPARAVAVVVRVDAATAGADALAVVEDGVGRGIRLGTLESELQTGNGTIVGIGKDHGRQGSIGKVENFVWIYCTHIG